MKAVAVKYFEIKEKDQNKARTIFLSQFMSTERHQISQTRFNYRRLFERVPAHRIFLKLKQIIYKSRGIKNNSRTKLDFISFIKKKF